MAPAPSHPSPQETTPSSTTLSQPVSNSNAPEHTPGPFRTNTTGSSSPPANPADVDRMMAEMEDVFNRFSASFDGILGILTQRLERLEDRLVAAIREHQHSNPFDAFVRGVQAGRGHPRGDGDDRGGWNESGGSVGSSSSSLSSGDSGYR